MKEKYISINNLKVSEILFNFINDDLLKNTKIAKEDFWKGFDKAVHELAPINKDLLKKRDIIQKQIDEWHIKNKGNQINLEEYKNFLHEIGYLKKVGVDFKIETKNVDDEISKIAGPQLVVPIMNARYALNAANARWMSLYDSLYGTDAIEQSEDSVSERYDPLRGEMVIKYGREFLDKFFPLENLSWKEITKFTVNNGLLNIFKNDQKFQLKDNEKFVGHRGDINDPSAIILKNNNLHIEILKDPKAFSAQQDTARISDIIIESAVSTICDNEDSVAAVDAEDKVLCYRNWLGLMRGDLKNELRKKWQNFREKIKS